MKIRLPLRCIAFGPLLSLMLVATPLLAQPPSPDGSDRHPSDLRYPLNTWTRREPLGWDLPNKQRRATPTATGIMSKLQGIVIPRIEFRRTTLSDAVEYLRQESQRLDPDPDPNARGVNIFVRRPKPSPAADVPIESVPGLPLALSSSAAADPNTRISLTMDRLPLLEALKYVASQVGMRVAVEPYAVAIVPLSYAIPTLATAEYKVPLELLGGEANTDDFCSRVDLKAWFEAKGIDFPDGASATYLTSTRILIVHNTQENLDKIVSVISSALKPAASIPQTP